MTDSNQTETMEVLPPSALQALERAHIDVQVSTAHQYPRSLELFNKRALQMATLDQETAESCIYVRPVGKKKNEKGQWVQEFAEGASIRLAEIVATSYGNIRVASRIVEQTERYVKCEGVAHDLETNYAGKSESFEPTVTREGKPYSEGMRAVVAKAALSKAYRDAIFKVVPRALCKRIYEAAKKASAGGLTIEQRRNKVKAWLGGKQIDEARMFAALGVNGWNDVGESELNTLTGIKSSIADGDTTFEEAFPIAGPSGERKPETTGHTQATGTTGKPAEKPNGKPQEAPGAATGTPTPPEAQTTQAPAKAAESATAQEEKAEAAMGLAPEQKAAEAPPQQEQAKPAVPPANLLPVVKDGDSAGLRSAKGFLIANSITEHQALKLLVRKSVAKNGQKLNDLSESKLQMLSRASGDLLAEIKAEPWE